MQKWSHPGGKLRELKPPVPFSEAAINFYRDIAGGILK
jgi:hypothetical protein